MERTLTQIREEIAEVNDALYEAHEQMDYERIVALERRLKMLTEEFWGGSSN